MINTYLNQFIGCHKGTINRIIHIIGFALIGLGIIEKSLVYVCAGGSAQELGHMYQYLKTRKLTDSPVYCIKPQLIFAYPLFILIILYILFFK